MVPRAPFPRILRWGVVTHLKGGDNFWGGPIFVVSIYKISTALSSITEITFFIKNQRGGEYFNNARPFIYIARGGRHMRGGVVLPPIFINFEGGFLPGGGEHIKANFFPPPLISRLGPGGWAGGPLLFFETTRRWEKARSSTLVRGAHIL